MHTEPEKRMPVTQVTGPSDLCPLCGRPLDRHYVDRAHGPAMPRRLAIFETSAVALLDDPAMGDQREED